MQAYVHDYNCCDYVAIMNSVLYYLLQDYINVKLYDTAENKSTYIVIKQTATIGELLFQAAKTLSSILVFLFMAKF